MDAVERVEQPTLDEFLRGYVRPMIDQAEKDIVRLRCELQAAEKLRNELAVTQRVLRSQSRLTSSDQPKETAP